MSKGGGPPKGKPWIWLTHEMLASTSWRSLSINARRLIDFLMIEHMKRGGKHNGRLLAPRAQLEEFGMGARHISAAIDEVMATGLIAVRRGIGRRPSLYALTWLPFEMTSEGEPQGDEEQLTKGSHSAGDSDFRREVTTGMTSEGKSQGYPKGSHKARSDFRREVIKADFKGIRREAPLKNILPGRAISLGIDEEDAVLGRAHGAVQ